MLLPLCQLRQQSPRASRTSALPQSPSPHLEPLYSALVPLPKSLLNPHSASLTDALQGAQTQSIWNVSISFTVAAQCALAFVTKNSQLQTFLSVGI